MVDTGAVKSAISARVLEGSGLSIRPVRRKWRSVDGPGRGILGEVGLTVRYEDTHVRLSEVIVFENQQIPLILGIEWIEAANVSVAVENHQGMVTLLGPKEMENADEDSKEAKKETFPVINNDGLEMTTNNEDYTKVNLPKVKILKNFGEGKATLPKIMEDPDEDLELEEVAQPGKAEEGQVNPKERDTFSEWKEWDQRRREYHARSDPKNWSKWARPQTGGPQTIGTLFRDENSEKKESWKKRKIKPLKGKSVPAWSRGFMKCHAPTKEKKTWAISSANGLNLGRGWAIPACLVTAENGFFFVPVINADDRPCRWKYLRQKCSVEEVDEEDGKLVLATIQPLECDWYNPPLESFSNMLDKSLTEVQSMELMSILQQYPELFRKMKGFTHLVEHCIDTGNSTPISTRPSRVSYKERVLIQDLVQNMLNDGIIEEANSPWSSRVVLAPKPNGGVRFCIDYRALNKVTVKDVHPLPVMDDLIGHLEGAKYYSTMDLEAGFWQIPVAECDRPKTAFVTPDGLYQFKRLPFGLQASPPNFQRFMNFVLKGQLWTECLCYLDDILVYGESFEEHNLRVDHVLASLSANGLALYPKQMQFWSAGYQVSRTSNRRGGNPS